MHGAGLYAAIALERPAILEFSTARIPNRNAPNLMNHIGGCYQVSDVYNTHMVRSMCALKGCGLHRECGFTRQTQPFCMTCLADT